MPDPAQAKVFFSKAVRAYQEQRFDAAQKHCGKALKADPDHVDALHLQGLLFLNSGAWEAAAKRLHRVAEIQPQRPDLQAQLGVALHQLGRLDAARAALEFALRINPAQPRILCELGKVFVGQDRYDDAYDTFSKAERLAPRDPAVHYLLGQTEYCRGNYESAVRWLRSAWEIDPGHAFTGVVLGRSHTALGQNDAAIAAYRQAIAIDAHCFGAYLNLGNLLDDIGRQQEALAVLEAGAGLNPRATVLLCALAEEYERANRLDEAGAAVARCLNVAPDDPHANLVAARLARRAGRIDDAFGRLQRLENMALPPERDIEVHFELGQLAEQRGEGRLAFKYFTAANRLQFAQCPDAEPRRQAYLTEIETLQTRFTAAWVAGWQAVDAPPPERTPVFMVGFPRSGTTLLDLMLHGHPQVTVMEEVATTLRLKEGAEQLPLGYPDGLRELDEAGVAGLRQIYWAEAGKHASIAGGSLLLDKMPLALIHVGLIHRVFPEARFIFATRHPYDVCLSCFMRHFEMNAAGVNFSSLDHIATLYERAMNLWQAYRTLLPLQYQAVRYEDVVADAERELRRLCSFLDLQWNDAMLDNVALSKGRGKINTPSYQQVAEPIYLRARYRWQRYQDELSEVRERLKPFVDAFGYAE